MMTLDDEPGETEADHFDQLIAADAALIAEAADSADRSGWEGECLELLDRAWPRSTTGGHDAPLPAQIGRYLIVRELGRGGFGVVYLARDPELGGREVALKTPRPGMADSPDVRRRFTREALAVAGLEHPNILPVHDARTVGPVAYIISTYCPGQSLAAWLKARTEPVPPRLAARLVEGLARGVEHAHARGILHRDLKPANVMLGPGGDAESAGLIPRLTDFGLAKLKLADDSPADETQTGLIIGSAPYMAPEQAASEWGEVGPATDVYALGATLYEVLVGRPPFGGASPLETLRQVLSLEPVLPQLCRREVPRDLQTICLHALRKNPSHRYPTAAAFGDDLARFLNGQAIVARPPSLAERAWRWTRQHPAATTSLAAMVLLVGLISLGMAWSTALRRSFNARHQREVARADRHAREVEHQRSVIAEREAITDRHLHAARLNLARQAIEAGQPERAQAVLSDTSAAAGSRRNDFSWRYLRQLSRGDVALWGRHDHLIRQLTLSPDGATLASSDLSGRVHLWDVATHRLKLVFGEATGTAEQLAFSPDGTLLAAARLAASPVDQIPWLTLHQVNSGRALARLDLEGAIQVDQVGFTESGRTLLAVVADRAGVRSVRGWSLASLDGSAGSVPPRFQVDGCRAATPTPDGQSCWINNQAGQLQQHDGATGELVRTLDWPAVRVGALAVSRDGRFLAVAVPSTRILLWDLNQPGPPRVVADEAILADELLFTGDGAALLAIAGGFQVGLIRLADGLAREILPLDAGRRGRLCFAVSPDGRWLASFGGIHPGGVQPVILWDTATGRAEKSFKGRRKIEYAVFDRRSGSLILGNDYDIAAWHPFSARGERLKRFDDHYDEVWTVAFAPDGATVASGGNDDRVRLWNPRTGARGAVLAGHKATVSTLAWHPGGERIATGSLSQDDNLKLWDVRTGAVIANLLGHTDKVRAVAFSPDGKVLASAGTDQIVRVWDGITGCPLGAMTGHVDCVRGLAFARDGRSLTSVDNDGAARIWDWANGRSLAVFQERYSLSVVAYSPDGSTLAWADEGGGIHLRDATTWRSRRVVQSDDREIRTLTFSPDSETLVSAGTSRTIRFWDPKTGHSLMEIQDGTSNQINELAFSPDGSLLVVADHGGRALVFHGPSQ